MECKQVTGISFSGLCLLWGIVTQCLNWANVIQWPWYAIWGPMVFIIAAWILAVIIAIIIAIVR